MLSCCSGDRSQVVESYGLSVVRAESLPAAFIVLFQASTGAQFRSSLFWDVTQQRVVVVIDRRFGTTCRSPEWERCVVPNRRSVITNIPVCNVPEERISLPDSVCYYKEFYCCSCSFKSLSIFIIGIYYGLGSRWRVTLPVSVDVCFRCR